MRLTVVGGCGAWPAAGQACSGYLVEHDRFRVLIDPGYAIVPRLLERIDATEVDAVLVSHSHPDHCADLHPLLRARVLREEPAPALPVHTLPGAVDRILDLEEPGTLHLHRRGRGRPRRHRRRPWTWSLSALVTAGARRRVRAGRGAPRPERHGRRR